MFVLQTRWFCAGLWSTQRFTREGVWGGWGTLEHGGEGVVFRLQASPACQ